MDWPKKIGRYRIAGLLATGGMAEIFLGVVDGPGGFRRPVVIKRILPHLRRSAEFPRMFLDEARIVASLHHPNIVQVHELGMEDEELFLVMEYLPGETLQAVVRRLRSRGKTLPVRLATHMVAEAAAGLHAAHELADDDGNALHLVHRDVSPQNIFVTYDGLVKLIDFGIAKTAGLDERTATGVFKGKIPYMSPEQTRTEALDRRTDIFSLGVVLHEVLTGQRLFKRESPFETMEAIRTGEVLEPSHLEEGIPAEVDATCMKALERDPAARHRTAAELASELVVATQNLRTENPVRQDLQRLMHELFEERIEKKQVLYRRVQAGSEITEFPIEPEGSGSEQVNSSSRPTASVLDTPRIESPLPLGGAAPRSRWLLGLIAVAAIVSVVGLVTFAGDAANEPPPVADTPTEVREAPPEPVAAVSPDPEPAKVQNEEPPAPVTVSVSTEPAGAEVVVAGVYRGLSPIEFTMARSDQAIPIEVSRRGFQTENRAVVLDGDQTVEIELNRVRAPRVRPRSPNGRSNVSPSMQTGSDTTMSGTGFFRFD